MNLETKITIYKFTPQLFTLTQYLCSILLPISIHTAFCTTAESGYNAYLFYSGGYRF